MSRTSEAYCAGSTRTTWPNFVFSRVMPWASNEASTLANHNSGSEGQNSGSLSETAWAIATVGCCSAIFRRGHQFIDHAGHSKCSRVIYILSCVIHRLNLTETVIWALSLWTVQIARVLGVISRPPTENSCQSHNGGDHHRLDAWCTKR